MPITVVSGDTLYRIATNNGASYQNAIILPQGSTSNIRLGSETSAISPGDQVILTQGPPVIIENSAQTFYGIARENSVDDWQSLIVLRGRDLFYAKDIPPHLLQLGDKIYIEHLGNCCAVAEESPTPTSEVEQAATEEGSGRDVEETTRTCDTRRVIVIDPGHGGWHNNAKSPNGYLEKDIALNIGLKLYEVLTSDDWQNTLHSRIGVCADIFLTRDEDVYVGINERRSFTSDKNADAFLSIHFNGSSDQSIRGVETFYRDLSNGNQSNLSEDIKFCTDINNACHEAIEIILGETNNRGVKDDTKTNPGALGVLRDAGVGLGGKMCKQALLEVEFLSNPRVELALASGPEKDNNIQIICEKISYAFIDNI